MANKTTGSKKGFMHFYLKWPLIIGIILVIAFTMVVKTSVQAGLVLLPFIIVTLLYALYLRFSTYSSLLNTILNFVNNNTKNQEKFLKNTKIPYLVCDEKGTIIYSSNSFNSIANISVMKKNISTIFSEVNKRLFSEMTENETEVLSQYNNKIYNVHIMNMDIKEILNFISGDNDVELDTKKIYLLYLEDKSDFYELKTQYENIKPAVGYINIDNFDEVTENLEDSKATMLAAMVDRKLTRYVSNIGGIIKKLEKDKYFVSSNKEQVEEMIKDRFSILDATKEVLGSNNIPLTLSIGMGYDGKSLETNHDYANIALDMALGRGGDQVVVKKGQELLFFGGKSASTSNNQRVRARVKAASFKEIINVKDNVFIVGHKYSDMDAFGASLGVYVMSKSLDKNVYIVENSVTKDVEVAKQNIIENNNFDKSVFINGDEALKLFDENSVLVLVDHNNGAISDEPRLINDTNLLVAFDHHRLSQKSIQNAIMSYIEPSASSTCELITEVMQYFSDKIKLDNYIADCMLCGIIIDTNNFSFMTHSKTFDAASYLKHNGASIDKVRKMLRTDFSDIKLIHEIEDNVEMYKDQYALIAIDEIEKVDMSVLSAKIANDLINIEGVKASVVINYISENNSCKISARSIDEVNVQVLMEKLGGGGHRGSAGASLNDCSLEEAMQKVKNTIDKMIDEKEIV